MTLSQHPLSAAFPKMSDDDFASLVDDITANGQRDPIWIFEGMVLDGWHRYRACTQLGIKPTQFPFPADKDPVAFVKSHNLHRRHLTPSQRAAAVVACAEWAPAGRPKKDAPGAPFATKAVLAKEAHVSETTIAQVKVAQKAGLIDAVKDGALTAKEGAMVARGQPEPPAKKGSPKSAGKQPAPAANDADDFDPVAELESAHAEITKLTEEIKAAEADDPKAEAIKWRRSYEHAQRQQSEAMDRAKQATDREAWTMRQLRRCGKAVGEDNPTKIAAAVEAAVALRQAA